MVSVGPMATYDKSMTIVKKNTYCTSHNHKNMLNNTATWVPDNSCPCCVSNQAVQLSRELLNLVTDAPCEGGQGEGGDRGCIKQYTV